MFKALALGTMAVIFAALTTAGGTLTYQTNFNLPVDLSSAARHSVLALVLGFSVLGLISLGVRGAIRTGVCFLLLAFASLSFGSASAFAQTHDTVSSSGPNMTFNYGDFLMQYGVQLAGWAVTVLAGVASTAIGVYFPWAKSIATQERLETAGKALLQFGINAVPDSVKDGKVTINAASDVIATAVAHGGNVLPAKVLKAAKGGGGLAAVIFRLMDLENGASKSNVLDPALQKLQVQGVIK